MKGFLQRSLLKIVGICSKAMSQIHAPFTRKKISAKHYHAIRFKLRPGMVLLSQTEGELSSLFIPGFWAHAGIVSDNLTVIEATSHGVVQTDLIDFMMKKDVVCALEPLFANTEEMVQAMIVAQAQIGKPYDFELMQSDIEKFYCSELVYFAYDKAVQHSPFKLRTTLGRETVTPQDFYDAKKKFKQIWHSGEMW